MRKGGREREIEDRKKGFYGKRNWDMWKEGKEEKEEDYKGLERKTNSIRL